MPVLQHQKNEPLPCVVAVVVAHCSRKSAWMPKLACQANKQFLEVNMPGHYGTKDKMKDKVRKVMGEYKAGKLKSSSGDKVKSRDQAVAIAMYEAGMKKGK
jgi:hypothetical protein